MSVWVHPTADVSGEAIIGDNTKIWNQAQVRERAEIGRNCIISKNVYIDSDVKIGDRVKIQNNVNVYHGVEVESDVFLGPSMTFTNDFYPRAFNADWKITRTIVKRGASLGAHVTVVCGNTIGEYSMIGSGSVITKNVPGYALMVGNPAHQIGWVCRCGHKLEEDLSCPECGKKYKRAGDTITEY